MLETKQQSASTQSQIEQNLQVKLGKVDKECEDWKKEARLKQQLWEEEKARAGEMELRAEAERREKERERADKERTGAKWREEREMGTRKEGDWEKEKMKGK